MSFMTDLSKVMVKSKLAYLKKNTYNEIIFQNFKYFLIQKVFEPIYHLPGRHHLGGYKTVCKVTPLYDYQNCISCELLI